ncbi:MAG: adenine methyltransferase [Armatimonadetes bacterium]|nr:adenine methyltransferase [Armatimonadota bacterium]MDE2205491.1 adenine methyltransferase [Armatimonadota bacterium]
MDKTKNADRLAVHFSSRTDLWATPADFFARFNDEFQFTLDVCALPENAKCERFFTPAEDGLSQQWTGVCWMNPPYGRAIRHWVEKAYHSARAGATVVCLLPARTDTKWWHTWVKPFGETRFIQGRLKFGNCKNSAPFPSAIVIFRPGAAPIVCSACEGAGQHR